MNSPYETNRHEYKDHAITIKWFSDDSMGPPWKEHDGHGIVSEWTGRDKGPGERLLCEDRSQRQFYDFAGTMRKAKSEGWGLGDKDKQALAFRLTKNVEDLTAGEITAEAVERDFRYLKDWCEDRWHWCGYQMTIENPDGDTMEMEHPEDSLWGIDSPSSGQFEEEALEKAYYFIDKALADAFREKEEAFNAACRDLVTV